MTRQNVLFIVFDQMRADCLHGALGSGVALPNFKEFLADAVSFTNHVSVTAPCGPARASLLTGQYAMNHRAVRNGTPLPIDKPNLATELRRGGMQPLLYGYTDTSPDPRHYAPDDPLLTSYEQVMSGFIEALELRFADSRTWRGYLETCGYDVPAGDGLYVPAGGSPDSPAFYQALVQGKFRKSLRITFGKLPFGKRMTQATMADAMRGPLAKRLPPGSEPALEAPPRRSCNRV